MTNMLGSWVNYLINREALKDEYVTLLVTNGDDTLSTIRKPSDIDTIISKYAALGIIIEKTKNYLSKTESDFLRIHITYGLICGLPLRAMTTLLWYKPTVY